MDDRKQQAQRGFSLVEILTAIAVFAVVIIAALLVYDRSNRMFKMGVESSNLQQNTRVAFEKLVSDMRMTGFDFDRDGIPTGAIVAGINQYQQPDEQFEYTGPAAVTIRGNFDYERETSPCAGGVTENCDHGREGTPNYESNYFPVVTTGNDEIITYALVPDSQGATLPACNPATNCIEFFADTHRPRQSYPDPTNGGEDENVVQITGVDLCVGGCNNPPYTLYRFTLDRDQSDFTGGTHVNRIPLASNIRSMALTYYQDAQGTDPLKDLPNTTLVDSANLRGIGRYMVANPTALVAEREIRAKIKSVKVQLVGMNEMSDPAFTQTMVAGTGTSTSIVADPIAPHYRQYTLETLVAPRNINRRGMREQDVVPPGPPTGVTVCTGHCGGVYISWTAPTVNAAYGAPEQYKVIYGPAAGTGFPCETTTFTQTFTYLFGTGSCALVPNVSYRFAVVALNGYGSRVSDTQPTATPLNATQPRAPVLTFASLDQNAKVILRWTRPTTNASGAPSCGPTQIPPAEVTGYKIERATSVTEPPATSTLWTPVSASPITMSSPDANVTWTDTTATNCIDYWYRVTTMEACALNAAYNQGNNAALGSSAVSAAIHGMATTDIKPNTPGEFSVDPAQRNADLGMAEADMVWPKVTTDQAGNPINVGTYRVYRRPLPLVTPSDVWILDGTQSNIPAAGTTVTYTSSRLPVNTGQQYQFTVAALQCSAYESDKFSPPRVWPCTFPSGVVGSPMLASSGAFDGSGTQAYPWRFFNTNDTATVSVDVTDANRVQSIAARVYNANGTLKTTLTASSPSWAFAWQMGNNTVERIDVTVTETGGCTRVETAYVGDMPQNCCLTPASFDATVMKFVQNTNVVDVFLKNICGEDLTLTGNLSITWNAARGGDKLTTVTFTPASGSPVVYSVPNSERNNATITVPIPTGTPVVPAGSSTYKVRVTFNQIPQVNPISAVNVTYRRAVIDITDQSCPVVP